ncbi:MAG: glycosyltransferase family 39 protein, partial [Candidatus Eremiobacteraeota bacterium]|nr:glycosyltransferase family 39 protein [Candidatus Eremiobacteraeota bacterium]
MRTSVGRIGWLLALVMGLRVALSVVAGIKVEEAYYWNYSQHPSLSYFDHPPMVAWLIRAATWVGGDSPFWVHLPGVASFSLLTLTLIWLGNRMFDLRTGLLAGLLVNLLPVFAVISLVTVPDLPLLLAWAVGMACGWRLVSEGEPRWWLAVGVATGLGLDSKYPALLIPLGVMLYLGWRREWRLLFNGWMVASAGLACVLFAPVILWNMQHHWASLLFQGRGRFAESTSLGERLGGWLIQVAALSPAGFWLLFLSLALAWKERERPQVAYLLCWS